MSTGSYPADFSVPHYLYASQSVRFPVEYPLYAQVFYPVGYSGSVILNPSPFPTGTVFISGSDSGSGFIPTVGQLWPRGNRGV